MASDLVADYIRRETPRLVDLWEAEVRRDLPPIRTLSCPALLDHLHELLESLAAWIEGETEEAERGFAVLVEGHTLQRLGIGLRLEVVALEFSKLRFVLSRELLDIAPTEDVRRSMTRLHEGLDHAMSFALHHYAERREDMRERFISILAHDLRDPLSTIVISTGVLARDARLGSEHQAIVARITRACDRVQHMVDDVLDFARAQLGGSIPVAPAFEDLAVICRRAASEVGATGTGHVIQLDLQGDLHGEFDRERVHQALTNLLVHAVHHADGPVSLTAREVEDAVETEVKCHGAPVSAEAILRMFDPLAAVDPARARTTLGLDLYIVDQIATAHGATVDVASSGPVTTYTIRWPRRPVQVRPLEAHV